MLGTLTSTVGMIPSAVLEQMELADLRALVRGMHAAETAGRELELRDLGNDGEVRR